jgi:hypothetical protein
LVEQGSWWRVLDRPHAGDRPVAGRGRAPAAEEHGFEGGRADLAAAPCAHVLHDGDRRRHGAR